MDMVSTAPSICRKAILLTVHASPRATHANRKAVMIFPLTDWVKWLVDILYTILQN
jgi:hypothetical protein